MRSARAADWPSIEAMLHTTWHDAYDGIMGPQKVDRILKKMSALIGSVGPQSMMDAGVFLTVQHDDRTVGMLQVNPTWLGRRQFIWMLYVHPEFQRRGIGRELLVRASELLPTASAFRLAVLPANTRAIAFYEKNGFHSVRRSFDPWTWQRTLLMERPVLVKQPSAGVVR
jgi:ribosomal protein S18 acetylase RimI-like enzyme